MLLKSTSLPIAILFALAGLTGCQVIQGNRSLPQYTSDASITARAKAKLINSNNVSGARVHIESDKGIIILSGFVRSRSEKENAENVVREVKGVIQVENKLEIEK
jgi:hyperosmotically inducible protein